jgi:MYXO-CTERM domain-containing protein
MLSCSLPLAVALAQLGMAPVSTTAIPGETPVHLGIGLRVINGAELSALLARQQDPTSRDFRRWLTPAEFGARFGQPADLYERAARWLEASGFVVTRFPNRIFLEAQGTSGQVATTLAVRLLPVNGSPSTVHVPDRRPTFPVFLGDSVVHVAGLNTTIQFKHRLIGTNGNPSLGPQDLRRFYDSQALLDQGFVGQAQQLVVLSLAEEPQDSPNPDAIQYFLTNISNSSAQFIQDVLPNPNNDFDQQPGGAEEFSLDVEMQSVGSPGAKSITLVVSPASEVFTTGVNHIVNKLNTATAVSVSLGNCEPLVQKFEGNLATSFQQLLQQGLAEGQTWSAASGDNGADDCQDGQTVAVDFPASIPEMVAMGGTEIASPNFDVNGALTVYQTETGWNDGNGNGAGGGGFSILYAAPSYQSGFAFTGRSVPDLALIAGSPGVLVDNPQPGELFPVGGTSVASPLSAGFFGLIASRVGCRLGDVHATLYMLGNAQLDGGAQVFHDIVTGTTTLNGVTGTSAGTGYDSVTGWGSLDVNVLAAAWPQCGDGGVAGAAYDACTILACDGGAVCQTIPEGPSSCVFGCDVNDADPDAGCPLGMVCSTDSLFAGDGGVCIPGCSQDADCGDGGEVCSTCAAQCVAPGKVASAIGDACNDSTDCPNGAVCTGGRFTGGYCTQACIEGEGQGAACSCPAGSVCGQIGVFSQTILCLESCNDPGGACPREGYICQSIVDGNAACLPPCHTGNINGTPFDSCTGYGSSFGCDTNTGGCTVVLDAGVEDAGFDAGPVDAGVDAGFDAGVDAGDDAGPVDGGEVDSGVADSGPEFMQDSGPPPVLDAGGRGSISSGGCNCATGKGNPDVLWGLAGLAALVRRRRRAADGSESD